jgi:hypothetical protein
MDEHEKKTRKCPNCSRTVHINFDVCPVCGIHIYRFIPKEKITSKLLTPLELKQLKKEAELIDEQLREKAKEFALNIEDITPRFKELEIKYKSETDRYAVRGGKITKNFIKWVEKNHRPDLALISKLIYSKRYIKKGVNEKDAIILGILELLLNEKLKEGIPDGHLGRHFRLDNNGNVIGLDLFYVHGAAFFNPFPEEICDLSHLNYLSISFGGGLPHSINKLKNLESFEFYGYELNTLPDTIGELEKLKYISICYAELESLPESIGKLKALEKLYLPGNKLKSVPESIVSLPNLRELNLSDNLLRDEYEIYRTIKEKRTNK